MSIYEEFINFLQKEFGISKQKPFVWDPKEKPTKGMGFGTVAPKSPKIAKGGVGSGRKAGSSSKLAAPKRGSPIKVAISRYQKRPSPSLHQKVVEAFRGKERKKVPDPLKGLKHPWD